MRVHKGSEVCTIWTKSQRKYTLKAFVKGAVIEFNSQVLEDPDLIRTKVASSRAMTFQAGGERIHRDHPSEGEHPPREPALGLGKEALHRFR